MDPFIFRAAFNSTSIAMVNLYYISSWSMRYGRYEMGETVKKKKMKIVIILNAESKWSWSREWEKIDGQQQQKRA